MSWSFHISKCVTKVNKKLGLLRRQSYVLTKVQRIDIYKTMIRPIIEYGAVLIDNCSTSDSLKLEKLQRTAALICTGAMRRTETKLLLDLLGWENLSDRRQILKMIIFFKICRNLTPTYLNRNLNPINNIVSNYTLETQLVDQLPRTNVDWSNAKLLFSPNALDYGAHCHILFKILKTFPFLKIA